MDEALFPRARRRDRSSVVSGEVSHPERGVWPEAVAARVMNWTYLIVVLLVVPVLAIAGGVVPVVLTPPGRRLRTAPRLGTARPYELRPLSPVDGERTSTCIVCRRPMADEQTHWRAIHQVPA